MKLRFLIDENLSPKLKTAIQRRYPDIDLLRVGDAGTPPLGTLDPDILLYLETSQRALITVIVKAFLLTSPITLPRTGITGVSLKYVKTRRSSALSTRYTSTGQRARRKSGSTAWSG
jgi:hypothetical protein